MNFDVLDLEKSEIVWQIDDAERVFFKADKREGEEAVVFGDSEDEDSGSESSHKNKSPNPPEKIYIIKKKSETVKVEEEKDDKEEKKDDSKTDSARRKSQVPKTPTKNAIIKLKNLEKKDDDGPKME